MQRVRSKCNFTASKTVIDTVIKKHFIGNRKPTARTVGKRATNWNIVDNESALLLRDLWNNNEEIRK
jgi:hypothetical protein